MRGSMMQSLRWFSPVALILLMVSLGIWGWHVSVVSQQMRLAAFRASDRIHLVERLGVSLRDAERSQQAYLLDGAGPDMLAYRAADLRTTVLLARLSDLASTQAPRGWDDATRGRDQDYPQVATLILLIGQRQAVLAQEVSLRGSGMAPSLLLEQHIRHGMPLVREVADQVATLRDQLEGHRQRLVDAISRGFLMVRWIAAAVAVAGVGGLLVTWLMLRRAWGGLKRAESEQRTLALQLRGSLDSLSQGVAVFSADGRLLNWNMRLRQMLDLPAALLQQDLSYDALESHLCAGNGAFLEPLAEIRRDLPDPGRTPVVYERAVPQRRGQPAGARASAGVAIGSLIERNIEIRRTLMQGGGFVLALTDMTERIQAERMLGVAQKMQAVGQLTGGIAHDFNNLLTVILGSLEMLPGDLLGAGSERSQAAAEQVRRAVQAAENGAALTRQLLGFARREPHAPTAVELSVALPRLESLLRPVIGEAIAINVAVTPQLRPAAVDIAQLESALLNLSLNARDAMPAGGVLSIEAADEALDMLQARSLDLEPGDYVRVAVSDTGQGMSSEVLSRACEPFFTTKPEGRGTGLGLAMVFGFARQSRGAVVIRSRPGEGTTVALYLPPATAIPAASDPVRLAARRPSAPPASTRPSIMVVEDDPAVREIAAEILRELGYRVSEAADPDAALRVIGLRDRPLDLLLTDIVLPGSMDGRALAEQARQIHPHLQVIFMSGYSDAEGAPDGALADTATLLGKPFRRAQLAALVAEKVGITSFTGEAA